MYGVRKGSVEGQWDGGRSSEWLSWRREAGHSGASSPPVHVSSLQELLQAKQDLQDLLIAKEEQEDLLRKRERELTALKGALKEEVSSHDQEMEKLKEQYDAELQALRESVEEATQVRPPHWRISLSGCQDG